MPTPLGVYEDPTTTDELDAQMMQERATNQFTDSVAAQDLVPTGLGQFKDATDAINTTQDAQDMVSGALSDFAQATTQPTPDAGPVPQPEATPQPDQPPTPDSTPMPEGTPTPDQAPTPVDTTAPPDQGTQTATPQPTDYQAMAAKAATDAGIDPNVFTRQINQESGFNPAAQSPAGAVGIAQFMPGTAKGLNVDPTDPQQSLTGAAQLMANYVKQYGGDYSKALAAYNAGPNGNWQNPETQKYVQTILQQPQPQAAPTPTPPHPTEPSATNAALQSGASPQTLSWARSQLGSQGYIDFCEKFVENAQGKDKVFPSAIAAWNAQQNVAVPGTNGIRPGDAVYFSPNGSNAGYGHTGIYSGNGNFISATDNGVREYDLGQWQKMTGQQLLGYVPGQGGPSAPDVGGALQNAWKAASSAVGGAVGGAASALGTGANAAANWFMAPTRQTQADIAAGMDPQQALAKNNPNPGSLMQDAIAKLHGFDSADQDPYFQTPVVGGLNRAALDPATYFDWGGLVAGPAKALTHLDATGIASTVSDALNTVGDAALSALGLDAPKLQPALVNVVGAYGPAMARDVAGVLNDTSRISDILAAPLQHTDPIEQAAYQAIKYAKDADIIQAGDDARAAAQAAVDAVNAHVPSEGLADAASTKVVQPITDAQQKVLTQLDMFPPAAQDAVVRDAARTASGLDGGGATSGLDPLEELWNSMGGRPLPETPEFPPTPPAPPEGPLPPHGAEFPAGAPPPVTPGGVLTTVAKNLPSLASGSAAAYETWDHTQDDALWQRVLLTGLAFEAGAGVPYTLAGGAPSGIPARALESYLNNLLGPNVAGLKLTNDLFNGITNPAFNVARSLFSGAGQALHGDLGTAAATWLSSPVEAGAYYKALFTGQGVGEGIQAALTALNPLNPARIGVGEPGLAELASTGNVRLIKAIQAFWTPVLRNAEQAGVDVAQHFGAAGVEGASSDLFAAQRASSAMQTGEVEGGIGRVVQGLMDAIQKIGGIGPFIQPFAKVPANLIDKGFSSLPVIGALNTLGAAQPEAVLARSLMGGMTLLAIRSAFETTGAGPSDKQQQIEWSKTHQPYSVRIPGANLWIPINRVPLPALRGALTVDAALNDAQINGLSDLENEQKVIEAFKSLGASMDSEPFLPQIFSVIDGVRHGDLSKVPSYVGSTVANFVPNHMMLYAKATQPNAPETSGLAHRPAMANGLDKTGAAIQSHLAAKVPPELGSQIPGIGAPPPALTATGKTIPNAQQGLGALSPLALSTQSTDPVTQMFMGAGKSVPVAPTKINIGGQDLELTGAEQERFNQMQGKTLDSILRQESGAFAKMTPQVKAKVLDQVSKEVRSTVAQQLFGQLVREQGTSTVLARAKAAQTAAAQQQSDRVFVG